MSEQAGPPRTFPSAAFAREVVAALAAHGVREVVLCPGSRSGPLAHALAAAGSPNRPDGAPEIDLHVRIDERAAAFLALGIARAAAAKGEPRPVAVVTTSGTAVGNLLPAVMEASHEGVPLLLLTADRPSELRGVGANQTTDQAGALGDFVRLMEDVAPPARGERVGRATREIGEAVRASMGAATASPACADELAGPVHLNLAFRAPLQEDGGPWPHVTRTEPAPERRGWGLREAFRGDPPPLPLRRRGIVIAGDGAGDAARRVAEAHEWPLLAEPTSGARSGPNCVPGYLALLRSDRGRALAREATVVVVIGRPTLTREIQELIAKAPELHVAGHGARWREAPTHADTTVACVPQTWLRREGRPDDVTPEWLDWWLEAPEPHAEQWGADLIARTWLDALDAGELAVIGSSGPIRAVDRMARSWAPGEAPVLIANRGLAGIDGTVSTAMGVALAAGAPAHALMGDVTLLHDAGGLLVGPRERRPDLRLTVVNDGGGTIFSSLEHAGADPDAVERVFTTPHGVQLADLASAYGWSHVRVETPDALAAALATPPVGLEMVEAVL